MTTEFKLPELGENIESGDVVSVLVSVGDTIAVDDPILELETDKATVEVPSSVSGVIKTVLVKEGDSVQVGQIILTTEDSAAAEATPAAPKETEPAVEETTPATLEPEPTPAVETANTAPQIVEIKLPDLGENVESGTVVGILVSVGDTVAKEQGILELETDKATVEVPSFVEGVVKEIHVAEGDTVTTDQLILTVETSSAPVSAPEKTAEPAVEPEPEVTEPEPETIAIPETTPEPESAPAAPAPATMPVASRVFRDLPVRTDRTLIPAAPNVRRIARELGVDIANVKGSGVKGRLTMDDVKRHAYRMLRAFGAGMPIGDGGSGRPAPPPLPDFSKWGKVDHHPMSNIRRATARQMDVAWSNIPHVTQFDKADITNLEQLRKRFGDKVEAAGAKLTITAILLKVVTTALKEYPQFNASIDMGKEEIIYKNYYNIGVAVDTDRGLLVPVIRDVDKKNILELAVELGEIGEKARTKKLSLADMQGGTFTVTNLGSIGGTNFTPIVNAPEVAILGVARGAMEPVFDKQSGAFEPRLMLPLSLSYDHRLIDGADGARFLRWIVQYLEQPFLTALQGW